MTIKIIVSDEETKKQLIVGSEVINYNNTVNKNHLGIKLLSNLYSNENNIIVDENLSVVIEIDKKLNLEVQKLHAELEQQKKLVDQYRQSYEKINLLLPPMSKAVWVFGSINNAKPNWHWARRFSGFTSTDDMIYWDWLTVPSDNMVKNVTMWKPAPTE